MTPPAVRTRQDLSAAARHVCYELEQLCEQPRKMIELDAIGDTVLCNASLEAMLGHARCLIEFLGGPRKTDRLHARDYIPGWKRPASADEIRLADDYPVICAHLSHLGWERVTQGTQEYEPAGLPRAVLNVFRAFAKDLRAVDEGMAGWFEPQVVVAAALLDDKDFFDPKIGLVTTTSTVTLTSSSSTDPQVLADLRTWRKLAGPARRSG